MSEIEERAAPQSACRDPQEIAYAYGSSSLGHFLAAVDSQGLCAVMFGDDHAALLKNLFQAFPNRNLVSAHPTFTGFVINVVTKLIEQPSVSASAPISIRDGDFGHLVRAALSRTMPGTTKSPEEVAEMIGASPEAAVNVRTCAATDLLAVVAPFHRLQERDGTSPAYRWGEARRQALLASEAAPREPVQRDLQQNDNFWPL
jgi:AraC family transcriptional regulator, regulatory protein of adaptative response / methylated-DNA-[protein]-cysteine methyltransferase